MRLRVDGFPIWPASVLAVAGLLVIGLAELIRRGEHKAADWHDGLNDG